MSALDDSLALLRAYRDKVVDFVVDETERRAAAELAALRTENERLRGALRALTDPDGADLLVIRHEDAGDVCAVCCRGPLWRCAEGCPVPPVLAVMEGLP